MLDELPHTMSEGRRTVLHALPTSTSPGPAIWETVSSEEDA